MTAQRRSCSPRPRPTPPLRTSVFVSGHHPAIHTHRGGTKNGYITPFMPWFAFGLPRTDDSVSSIVPSMVASHRTAIRTQHNAPFHTNSRSPCRTRPGVRNKQKRHQGGWFVAGSPGTGTRIKSASPRGIESPDGICLTFAAVLLTSTTENSMSSRDLHQAMTAGLSHNTRSPQCSSMCCSVLPLQGEAASKAPQLMWQRRTKPFPARTTRAKFHVLEYKRGTLAPASLDKNSFLHSKHSG
ncbi:uncharacterized protein LY79DRAFT_582968 [Colletotrichum navitas]|uniref:Uncharacterized protein n=1 Tax=Colletotrichum navitas TaxID=681940 RepID=A0AAD8PQD4_9PEZI|nr:uncharacterized protein LY79DRAFT_582968 [Colletotrichum navitas]KAK1574479.1 hypothetical protein LY79DRAFT_582968 [Colletotrichum navitas]